MSHPFVTTLQRLPHLVLIPIDPILAQQALETAALNCLRGSDAIYAVVALRFACHWITFDREQHDRVASVLQTRYPAEILDSV